MAHPHIDTVGEPTWISMMRKNTTSQKELAVEAKMPEEKEVMSLKPESIGPVPPETDLHPN